MKMKRFSLMLLLFGVLLSIIGTLAPYILLQSCVSQDNGIGIVGGADTPTYSLIVFRSMNGLFFVLILLGVTLITSALFCLIFPKTIKKYCGIFTSLLSIGISSVGALGLVCVFTWFSIVAIDDMSSHYPVAYPLSISLGLICLIIFLCLISWYALVRMKSWSVKGFFIDVLTSIVYLPSFFFVLMWISEMLR